MNDFKNIDKKLMTKTSKLNLKSQLKYRSFRFFFCLFLISFFVFSISANAAECLTYSSSSEYSGRTYSVYYHDYIPIESCADTVILTPSDYNVMKLKADEFERNSMTPEHFEYLTQFLFAAFAFFAYVKGFSNGNTRD